MNKKKADRLTKDILMSPNGLLKIKAAMLNPIIAEMEWRIKVKISEKVDKLFLDPKSWTNPNLRDLDKIKNDIVKELRKGLES